MLGEKRLLKGKEEGVSILRRKKRPMLRREKRPMRGPMPRKQGLLIWEERVLLSWAMRPSLPSRALVART